MKCSKFFSTLLAVLLFWGCAQMRGLEGGAKDVTPPQLTGMSIDSLATNFRGQAFELSFSEWVQAANAQEVLVSPSLKQSVSLKAVKNHVVVSWNDTLLPNTTYTFEFGGAISDITEGNKASVSLVFSTGSTLDSARIAGNLVDGISGEVPQKAIVVLYADSLFGKPVYVRKPDAKGDYLFEHLPNKAFFVAAFNDANENRLWDEDESGDFYEYPYETSNTWKLNFHLAPQVMQKLNLDAFKTDSVGCGYLPKSLGMKFPVIVSGTSAERAVTAGSYQENDTLFFAMKGTPEAGFQAIRTEYNGQIDTLSAVFNADARLKAFQIIQVGKQLPGTKALVKLPCAASLLKYEVPVKMNGVEVMATLTPTKSPLHYVIETFATKEECKGKLTGVVLPGSFKTVYGTQNDSLKFTIDYLLAENLGDLALHFNYEELKSVQRFVELRDSKGNVVAQQSFSTDMLFTGLKPDSYTVRVVQDANGNRLYDIADTLQKRRPEVTVVFAKPIEVRANWSVKMNLEL